MATTTRTAPELEAAIRDLGADLAARMPAPRRLSAAGAERRLTELMMSDPQLRAALFRFVDVRPACADHRDLVRHLHELLAEALVAACEDETRERLRAAGLARAARFSWRRTAETVDAILAEEARGA